MGLTHRPAARYRASRADDGRISSMTKSVSMAGLAVLMLLALLSGVEARSPHPPPVRRLSHPRSSLEILPRQASGSSLVSRPRSLLPTRPPPHTLKHSDKLVLTLSLPDLLPMEAHLLLRPTEHLFHPDAIESIQADGGQRDRVLRSEDYWLYQGEVVDPRWLERAKLEEVNMVRGDAGVLGTASIMVHDPSADGSDPVYEGSFTIFDTTYQIMTKEKYDLLRTDRDVVAEEFGKLVVFRDADMYTDEEAEENAGHEGHETHSCAGSHPYNAAPGHPVWQNRHASSFLLDSDPFAIANDPFVGLVRRSDLPTGGMTSSSNFIDSINSTQGCPNTQQIVYMGVALDCNYVAAYGSSDAARTQVLNNWNQASALYKATFNISLGITQLVVMNESCASNPGGEQWNVGCDMNLTLDERLSRFSQWRGQRSGDGIGLWHLMSACPTNTEVGVAWLGTLCETDAQLQSGSYVSGTGISTASKTEWSLVSHEIGHGFGAIHDCTTGCSLQQGCCPYSRQTCSAGGRFIMNPTTSSVETRFSGCTLGNICSNLGSRAVQSSCIQTPGSRTVISLQQCGNGIVEPGEDCDPGANSTSTCCDPSTCKFRSGAVCDPANAACCTDTCQFSPSSQVCRPAVNADCDIAEYCTGNNATCPKDVTQPDGKSCGSNGLACASGTCTSLDRQCATVGSGLGLSTACGQRADTSCVVTCRDPRNSNQCIVLQSPLVDGSPCGYGGHCYNQTCQAGSWQEQFNAMYTQNLQISIPVTIVVGLLALGIIAAIVRCLCCGCCGYGRKPKRPKNNNNASLPPPPMRQSQQSGFPPPPPPQHPAAAMNRHSSSLSSQDPITHTNVIGREPSPPNRQSLYGGGSGYYGQGQPQGDNRYSGYHPQNGSNWPSYQPGGAGPQANSGWVDERAYNGPYYGQQEAYGR